MTFNRPQGDNSDVNIGINITTNKQQLAASQRDIKAFKQQLNEAFGPDNAATQQAMERFRAHRAEIDRNREAAKQAKSEFVAWREAIADLDRNNAIEAITADMVKAIKGGDDLTTALARVKGQLQEIGATRGEISRVLGAAQTAAASGGGRGLQTFGREAKLAVPALPIPGTGLSSESLFRIVEVAGRVQQAFGNLSPAMQATIKSAGLLSITLGLVVAGLSHINEQFAKQTRAIIDSQEEATRLRLQGSREEIEAAIEKKRQEDEITRARIEENKRLLQAVEQGAGPVGAALADVFNVAGVQELRKNTQELEQSLETNAVATGRLTGLLDDEGVQARLTAEALEELRKARQDEIDELARTEVQLRTTFSSIAGGTAEAARSRLASITAEREALNQIIQEGGVSTEAMQEFAADLNRLGQEFQIVQGLLPELENIERVQQAQEDQEAAQKQLIDLTTRAIDIETRGQERINNVIEQGVKQTEAAEERLADARLKLVDFNRDAADKAAEINRKFMADDLKRLDDYIIRERRIKRDQRIELLRLAQDEKEALLDAEQENNVAAFIQAKRNFDRQRKEQVEDNRIDAGDRAEDLQRERAAIEANRDERLAALQAETDKKRADLQAEIAEREAALQTVKDQIEQRVQAERDAIKQSLNDLVSSFDDSTTRMEQILAAGFDALATNGITATNAIIDNLNRRAQNFIQQTQLNQSAPPRLPAAQTSNPFQRTITAFATGGVVTKPTMAYMGDRRGFHEALIPFRPSEGIESAIAKLGLGGGQNVTINIDGVAPGVTPFELDALEQRISQGVYMGFNALRTGVAPGAA